MTLPDPAPRRPALDRSHAVRLGVGALVAVAVFFGLRAFSGGDELEDGLEAAVAQLAPSLPIPVDEATTWTGLEADGDTLVTTYTLAGAAAEYDGAALEAGVRPGVVAQVCASGEETLGRPLALGATFLYRYVAEDGRAVGEFSVDEDDCEG